MADDEIIDALARTIKAMRYDAPGPLPPIVVPAWLWDALEGSTVAWWPEVKASGTVIRHDPTLGETEYPQVEEA